MSEVNQTNLMNEPEKITFLNVLMRLLAGLGGGVVGSLVLGIIYMFSSSVLGNIFSAEAIDSNGMIFKFILMIILFITSLTSNISGTTLIALTNREKYTRIGTTMYHVFIFNIVTFVFVIPLYFLLANLGSESTIIICSLHILLSAVASVLILEILSNNRYVLLNVYSILLAVLFATAILAVSYQVMAAGKFVIIILAMPLLWGLIGFSNGLFAATYRLMYDLYGIDFFNMHIDFGKQDYLVEEEDDNIVEEVKKDVSGKDFFNK